MTPEGVDAVYYTVTFLFPILLYYQGWKRVRFVEATSVFGKGFTLWKPTLLFAAILTVGGLHWGLPRWFFWFEDVAPRRVLLQLSVSWTLAVLAGFVGTVLLGSLADLYDRTFPPRNGA